MSALLETPSSRSGASPRSSRRKQRSHTGDPRTETTCRYADTYLKKPTRCAECKGPVMGISASQQKALACLVCGREIHSKCQGESDKKFVCPKHDVVLDTGNGAEKSPKARKMPITGARTPSASHSGAYAHTKVIRKGGSLAKQAQVLFGEKESAPQEHLWLETRPLRDWQFIEVGREDKALSLTGGHSFREPLLPLDLKEQGKMHVESGRNDVPFSSDGLDEEDSACAFYPWMFNLDPATRDNELPPAKNYLVNQVAGGVGTVVATVAPIVEGAPTRVLIRTKFGCSRFLAPVTNRDLRSVLAAAKQAHPRLRSQPIPEWEKKSEKIFPVTDKGMVEDLVQYEVREVALCSHYKVGVLYVKAGQTDENEIFSNVAPHTEAFEHFLALLGDRVQLSTHKGYTGGLDTRGTNTTGTHSIYTKYRNIEVMFHVATMLPNQERDLQRIEKKRHLGNDVMMVVFVEEGHQFDPRILTNQFNHVFIVVQPVTSSKHPEASQAITRSSAASNKSDLQLAFRVCVASKAGVEPFGPFVPMPAVFAYGNIFREWLLQKIINGERGALYSQTFKANFMQTRRSQLESLASSYKPDKSAGKAGAKVHAAKTPAKTPKKKVKDRSSITASPGEDSSGSLVEVVAKGKTLVQLTNANSYEFNSAQFRQTLHDVFQWTLSREAMASADVGELSKEQHDAILGRARKLVTAGTILADVREQLQQGFSQDDLVEIRATDQLKIALASFFQILKDIRLAGGAAPGSDFATQSSRALLRPDSSKGPKSASAKAPRTKKVGHRRSASTSSGGTAGDESSGDSSKKSRRSSKDAGVKIGLPKSGKEKKNRPQSLLGPASPFKLRTSVDVSEISSGRRRSGSTGPRLLETSKHAKANSASPERKNKARSRGGSMFASSSNPPTPLPLDGPMLERIAESPRRSSAGDVQHPPTRTLATDRALDRIAMEEADAAAIAVAHAESEMAQARRIAEAEAAARQAAAEAAEAAARLNEKLVRAAPAILNMKTCMIQLLQQLTSSSLDWQAYSGQLMTLGQEAKLMMSLDDDVFAALVDCTKAVLLSSQPLRDNPDNATLREEVKQSLRDVTLELRDIAALLV